MYIYVQDKDGRPLMPTMRCGKVRRMLRDGRAVCVRRTPFTIRLLYETSRFTQDISLGVDAGAKVVGLSATIKDAELYHAEVSLRGDIVRLLSQRAEARRFRRYRKTRYRAPRFDNRRASKREGWLAPSVSQKVHSHLKAINDVCRILPVRTITVEVAQFDMQRIKNPDIAGEQYQQGAQLGFWNVREYVFWRDGHRCRHCGGKSKDPVLNVHHLESRMTGGDSPDNLVTLCETCHKAYHRGEIDLKLKRISPSLRDAAAMNIMRWRVYDELKRAHADKTVRLTYGYVTKDTRIRHGLDKSHAVDARCISGHPTARPAESLFIGHCVARHERSLHVRVPVKGGKRRSTIASHKIGTSRLQRFDSVLYDGKVCIISGSTNGRLILKDKKWKNPSSSASVNAKSIRFLSRKHGSILWQQT